jgi:hypothetical protein
VIQWPSFKDANSFPAFKLMNNSELQVQARKVLDTIAFMPFEQCQPLTRGFESIPARPGIYAVRHKTDEDVRIAVEIIAHWGNPKLLLEIESIILRATEPSYNVQIPAEM